jgi:hypothetical protein
VSPAPQPNSHTLVDASASDIPAPVLLSPYPQQAALADPKPSTLLSHTPKHPSSSELQSQASHSEKPDKTLRPVQDQEISFISGDVEVSETRSDARPEAIHLREDDEDEEIPTIDMESDSD